MFITFLSIFAGLILLIWSADRFVNGASSTAKYFGISYLFIGMVIVGFGTSAPEMVVSVVAAYQNNAGIALGNAYGSNIVNIAFILGVTALISPIVVNSQILRKELPFLTIISLLAFVLAKNGLITRTEASILFLIFLFFVVWALIKGQEEDYDTLGIEIKQELSSSSVKLSKSIVNLITGLLFLIISSRILVWGSVNLANKMGISDLVIGLTIVAIGTSLPELASSIIAARKNEHEIAFGNIIGSNIFNTLAVVGTAGIISPIEVGKETIARDIPIMIILTVILFLLGYGFSKSGRINRIEGGILVLVYVIYTLYILKFITL